MRRGGGGPAEAAVIAATTTTARPEPAAARRGTPRSAPLRATCEGEGAEHGTRGRDDERGDAEAQATPDESADDAEVVVISSASGAAVAVP